MDAEKIIKSSGELHPFRKIMV